MTGPDESDPQHSLAAQQDCLKDLVRLAVTNPTAVILAPHELDITQQADQP
jgi:hypothetical protein